MNSTEDERKLCISMLGKLDVSMARDTEQLERVARLAQEAIDEKVADDAPTRTALSKFHTAVNKTQNGRSRSRAPSRAPSIAPSTVDDIAETLLDESVASHTVRDENSVAPETPAPSPRKKTRGRGPPSPKRRTTQQPVQEVLEDITEISTVTDNLDVMAIKEEDTTGDQSNSTVSQQPSSRPKWRPEELKADTSIVPQQVEPPTTEADEASDETKPVEAPKRRGRPPKAVLSTADVNIQQPAPRAARKSVRASRRQQAAAASNADVDESMAE